MHTQHRVRTRCGSWTRNAQVGFVTYAALQREQAALKAQFDVQIKHVLENSLRQLLPSDASGGEQYTTDEKNQVLNEEGLPFVDPLEQLPDSPPRTPDFSADRSTAPTGNVLNRAPGHVVPFLPERGADDDTSRKAWMDSVLAELEAEEAQELADAAPEPATSEAAPSKLKSIQRGFLQRKADSAAEVDPQPTRPKKQVRIAVPEESESEDEVKEKRSKSVHYGRHPDDVGVEEEAQRIVNLLGPEVIQGHPNAERIFADMKADQQRVVQAPQAPPPEPSEPAKPAIGESIVERSAAAPADRAPPPRKKLSAFKQRQLERQGGQSDVPEAPQVSQGIPAIERAGRADEPLERRRAHQGLPPQVPHARPSKAYAERLEKREKGEATGGGGALATPAAPARASRVRFGAPTVVEAEPPMDVEDEHEDEPMADDDTDEENPSVHPYEQDSDAMESDDGLWDSDDEYTAEDLEALKPTMAAHSDDAFWSEELAREYAEAKARLALPVQRPMPLDDDEDAAEEYGVAPLDASLAHTDSANTAAERERPKVSRFKAARMAGEPIPDPNGDLAARREDAAGRALADEVDGGAPAPVMVLPSLAPVRYPKPTPDDPSAIDLDGESDEDDDRLQELMRARLALDHDGSAASAARASHPPSVGHKE